MSERTFYADISGPSVWDDAPPLVFPDGGVFFVMAVPQSPPPAGPDSLGGTGE